MAQQLIVQCIFELKPKLNKDVFNDFLQIIGQSYVPSEEEDEDKEKIERA